MRPQNLKTRIFLDGGDPVETKEIKKILGFLDGQTTNPTLIARNPEAKKRLERGERFGADEIIDFYHEVVMKVSDQIPGGSVSVEVYADRTTRAEAMLEQGREMYSWIPNAHVKFPTTSEGLKAAARAVEAGMRVNMTLCFSQEQAAAVYAATRVGRKGQVYVSPFVGRLDDRGKNGMDLIANIMRMYAKGDGHVEVLTASVRTEGHLLEALRLRSDIITAPFPVLKAWGEKGMPVPGPGDRYDAKGLAPIAYRNIDLTENWQDYDLKHELTEIGMEKFSADWAALIKPETRKIA